MSITMGCTGTALFESLGLVIRPISVSLKKDEKTDKLEGEIVFPMTKFDLETLMKSNTQLGNIRIQFTRSTSFRYLDCTTLKLTVYGAPGERIEARLLLKAQDRESITGKIEPLRYLNPQRLLNWLDTSIELSQEESEFFTDGIFGFETEVKNKSSVFKAQTKEGISCSVSSISIAGIYLIRNPTRTES